MESGNENNGTQVDGAIRPLRPLWADLLIIVGVYIGTTILLSVVVGFFAEIVKGDILRAGLVATLLVYAVTIPVAVLIMRQRGAKGPILSFSLRGFNPALVLWGFLLIAVMGVVIEPLLMLFPAEGLDKVNQMITSTGGFGMICSIVLIPALEETFFRGVIQGASEREWGPQKAILIAAAIFGIVHLVPQQVVNAFFAGVIFGYVYYRTRSLVSVIAIHILNNAVAYIIARMMPDSTVATLRNMVGNDVWYWIIYAACAAIFVLALYNVWRRLDGADKKTHLETK